jgi:hypothetical protein
MVPVSRFAQCENKGWEADERPEPRSLGLLPSGPDPVGEWLVHRQPPGDYIGRGGGESKPWHEVQDGLSTGLGWSVNVERENKYA